MLGRRKVVRDILKDFYVGIGISTISVITSLVLLLYTLNVSTTKVCRDIQLTAGDFSRVFAKGQWCQLPQLHLYLRTSLQIILELYPNTEGGALLLTVSLAMTVTGFKGKTGWMKPRPKCETAWY